MKREGIMALPVSSKFTLPSIPSHQGRGDKKGDIIYKVGTAKPEASTRA